MKRNIFIIILFISIFTILAIIYQTQIQAAKTENSSSIAQAETVSITQNLQYENTDDITATSSTVQNIPSSAQTRQQEIENRINQYGKQENGIPVLMYHFFYDASTGNTDTNNNFIEISKFEQHLKYLKENDFFFPTFEELLQFITVKQVLKDIGYKVAFTTKGGRVKIGMNPFELPRVRILRDDSMSSFINKVC